MAVYSDRRAPHFHFFFLIFLEKSGKLIEPVFSSPSFRGSGKNCGLIFPTLFLKPKLNNLFILKMSGVLFKVGRNLSGEHFKVVKNITSATMKFKRNYNTLNVTQPYPFVSHVVMNRPNKLNALNNEMWLEFEECFNHLSDSSDCRVVVLSGAGKIFTAGLDFGDAMKLYQNFAEETDIAKKCKALEKTIKQYQNSFNAIEKCSKPVIAAIHGSCIGGGVDMISATDIRYCSADASFVIKEVDLGMAADVGTLQRLPKIIGSDSLVRELCYTGRQMLADEALKVGLVSEVLSDQESLMKKSFDIAQEIATKSPVAIQGIKLNLNYSRDHTVEEGLNHILMRNQAMMQSEDFIKAATSLISKDAPPVFSKL